MELKPTDSLTDRFNLANELARAVSCVHTFGFVHKNIRPETILLLTNVESCTESAFLIGFDSFRMASGKTLRKGEIAWERCLYQHPNRIGNSASEDYIMQHDIYSLGVCLLEIGLWEPLVTYKDENMPLSRNGTSPPALRASFLEKGKDSYIFKDQLLSLARGELRRRMGTQYSEVVVTCLTCLDPENGDFGDEAEFQDEEGIEVGVRYIEKVSTDKSTEQRFVTNCEIIPGHYAAEQRLRLICGDDTGYRISCT
jgi:serine/threonine protein kinase